MTKLLVMLCLITTSGAAVEILGEAGIGVVELKESAWRSRTMLPPAKLLESERIWSGTDFFTGEFGQPLAFTRDRISEDGFASGPYAIEGGSLVFTTGEAGFRFGFGSPGKDFRSGGGGPAPIRFACDWGRQKKDVYRIRMELEQDVDQTAWTFRCGEDSKTFAVVGRGRTTAEADLGMVRVAIRNLERSFSLACTTPKATVRVRGISIAPSSAEVCYRREFELAEPPVLAHASFTVAETYELSVNGERIDAGTDIYPCAMMKSVDLRPHLRKGRNTIAFVKQSHSWKGDEPAWLFEAVAVGRDGAVTRVLGDGAWRCSRRRAEGWTSAGFDDSAWAVPKLGDASIESVLAKGDVRERIFTGFNPKHMGRLSTQPVGRQQPLFDDGEPVRFTARLPIGYPADGGIRLEVRAGGSEAIIETIAPAAPADDGDFRSYAFELGIRRPGPYRLDWRLLDAQGQVVETRRDEAVIIGRIDQDEIGPAGFEAAFEDRLRLVAAIDCTRPATDDAEFIDHTGMCGKAATDRGRVVERAGLTYRETGPGRWDYFAYRLRLADRGEPHLAEVIVPDDADRYIYSGIVETYPVDFCNNLAQGGRGWYTATATAVTGVRNPLSGGKRRIRFVFYPGSANEAIAVMSGFSGSPAAASAINIYRIEGGLPALAVPDGNRIFGSHNERISTMRLTTGMAEQPMMNDRRVALGLHQDAWLQWYRTLERKIRLLRHQGYNMSVEGVYMYNEGDYPSARHNVQSGDGSDFDPVPLMLRMYERNRIRCLLGFEYIASPQIDLAGRTCVSERRMWKGAPTTRLVDRYGRQLVSYMAGGYDFLNPDVAATMLDCIAEIRQRYASYTGVSGFFLVNGAWWLPTLNTGAYPELADLEVGYGDDAVRRFEHETGIGLGIDPADALRFQKRYDQLSGRHRSAWTGWRARKMQEFSARIAAVVQDGGLPWKVYQSAIVNLPREGSPYGDVAASREKREGYVSRRYAEFGIQPELYGRDRLSTLVPYLHTWALFGSPQEDSDLLFGWLRSPDAKRLVGRFSAAYLGVSALDEVDCPATAAKRWLWSHTTRGVFTPRPIGDNCMNDFVEATMIGDPPAAVFDQWVDCNLTTGFGEQTRRFARSFYATPEAAFVALPAASVHGITAQMARLADGQVCLRLVNNTPYPCSGRIIATAGAVRDLVFDADLVDPSGQGISIGMPPNDVRVFRIAGLAEGSLSCRFGFPAEVEAGILQEASAILEDESLLRRIPGDLAARMARAAGQGDGFALHNAMNDPEVVGNVRSARAQRRCAGNQALLLGDLERTGRARIDCGSRTGFTDAAGERWLPDQESMGGRSYGSSGATFVDRGNIGIAGTGIARVYQTEAYGGRMVYTIPVPEGSYRIRLHVAETYAGHTRAGQRQIGVSVNGRALPERIDPIALAKGAFRACVFEVPPVPAVDGVLSIGLSDNACINGIEVVACDPGPRR